LLDLVSSNQKVDVIIDCGALVNELGIRQVAEDWLQVRKDRVAAVFFNSGRIEVVDRFGVSTPLAVSPYESNLEDCLLFLDDEHTRGSDFKLPQKRKAVVTLGKGLQKDKLLQAVMRMRMLGQGQTVTFLASFEADLQIAKWRKSNPNFQGMLDWQQRPNSDNGLQHLPAIMSWCLHNTVQSSCDKLLYVASQGAVQLRKRHAQLTYANDLKKMAECTAENEALSLQELYAYQSNLELLPNVVQRIMGVPWRGWVGRYQLR